MANFEVNFKEICFAIHSINTIPDDSGLEVVAFGSGQVNDRAGHKQIKTHKLLMNSSMMMSCSLMPSMLGE